MRSPLFRIARRQSGMSLVELLVSVAIGLFLMAGITILISQQSSARSELEKASRQIENGRYAAQLLQDDIRLAGYYGPFSNLPAPPPALQNPCALALADLESAMPVPVQGYDAPAAVPAPLTDFLPDASHVAGTDILVIRRADTTAITPTAAVAGQTYLQATQAGYVFGTGSDPSVFTLTRKDGATLADLRNYVVNIYYVSPCSKPSGANGACAADDDGGHPVPTLKRRELTVTGTPAAVPGFQETPLVDGIQDLQIDYGLDDDGDGGPDRYVTEPAAAEWDNVITVRLNLLARNNEISAGHKDTKFYNLGLAGDSGPFNDAYKRHVFSELVRVENPSARREK